MGWIIGLTCLAAWFNHIFTCFSEGLWGFSLLELLCSQSASSTAYGCGSNKDASCLSHEQKKKKSK